MRIALAIACFISSAAFALTPNLPRGEVEPRLVVNTRIGQFSHMIRYAAPVVVPAEAVRGRMTGRGVYVVEVGIVSGYPLDVRVLRTSGYRVLDEAALTALRQWRFRPRSILQSDDSDRFPPCWCGST